MVRRLPVPRLLLAIVLALPGGCGSKADGPGKRPPPLVRAAPAERHRFVQAIEAIGTARANEQVTLSAVVTERVDRVLFDDGMAVGRGQLLAVLTQAQETASLQGAVAIEAQASAQLARIQALYDRGFATRAQLDQLQATATGARAAAAGARAAIGDRLIRAPFAGVVGLRTISPGAIVTSGSPLVTISDVSRIKLDFTVPETQLAGLAPGQAITATAAAFPGERFTGTIAHIDPAIDPNSRAVLVRAVLPNPGARLKPGMLMNVTVSLAEHEGLAIPEFAIAGRGDDRFVFVVTPDRKARRVPVRVGLRDAGLVEVIGLPPAARVIGEGVVKVADGMSVRLGDGKGAKAGKSGQSRARTAQAFPRSAPGPA
ncbi:efflux RND transporter periplasmic adaptor subunit [Novosphingobium flavum]|uniref:Efflux RND transporter periplasmic adaptor subunit n=1 Tax=Novosphingobium aerophilum TaxID=2839843 RepID=A0A7X1F7B7_9SPHN|nr:efflux RND transporter periplasmic adaptor subunit [Novosphingobium aerophilum]MBC2651389.1 efflux RND transporter periplasmic adaptor subunit [Novosphingobium aerophilum]MBC2661159.1 efflux RND transporter periplasmic adaptor subunit [Novosphingobium aerophilum]